MVKKATMTPMVFKMEEAAPVEVAPCAVMEGRRKGKTEFIKTDAVLGVL